MTGSVLWHYYRNRDGAFIPWIFQKGQDLLVLSYVPVETPQTYDYNILRSFLKDNPRALGVLVTTEHSKPRVIERRLLAIPSNLLF